MYIWCLELNSLKFNSSSIFPIDSDPFGVSYGEWAIRWWQWLLSIPKSLNPSLDTSGKNAHNNQKYPNVLFLCQTYEDTEFNPIRWINICKNTAIFIPVINWISLLHHDGESDRDLLDKATSRMDVVGNMEISINGFSMKNQLHNYRVLTPFFIVELPEDNIVDLAPGARRAIADGYWVFLKPLPKGVSLKTFGSCSSGATKIGVHYEITVPE